MKQLQSRKDHILILDCHQQNALALIRHIGKKKTYMIEAVSHSKASLGFFSKYVDKTHIVCRPEKDPKQYIESCIEILSKNTYLILLPVSHISFQLCSQNRDRIRQYTHLIITTAENITLASSKRETYLLAENLGVPYPEIASIGQFDDIVAAERLLPCVIKAPFEAGRNIVEYANSAAELRGKFTKMHQGFDFKGQYPIVQKYVKGEGFGFFAFYKNGECRNYFMHKRLREYPVTGGASTAAESYVDEKIAEYGLRILDHLKWEGVAMVEFKRDRLSGEYYLMEINAKFWGSLELALVAGVDFPQMLIDDALGNAIRPSGAYKMTRFQWLLNGDLFHVLERPWHIFSFIRDLFVAKNDFYFTDIKPNLFQLLYIPVFYYKKWFK